MHRGLYLCRVMELVSGGAWISARSRGTKDCKGKYSVGGNGPLGTCVTEAGMKYKLGWLNVPGASRLGMKE